MAGQASHQEQRHMLYVASLGCIVCRNCGHGVTPMEMTAIHHVRWGQGMAQRAGHYLTLPLCARHHQTGGYGVAFHAGMNEWEHRYGSEHALLVQVYMMLERGGELNVLAADGGCGCEYCRGGWRDLLGVEETHDQ